MIILLVQVGGSPISAEVIQPPIIKTSPCCRLRVDDASQRGHKAWKTCGQQKHVVHEVSHTLHPLRPHSTSGRTVRGLCFSTVVIFIIFKTKNSLIQFLT